MKTFLFILFVFAANGLFAQGVIGQDTLSWSSARAINNGNTISLSTQFISFGHDHIDWVQTGGDTYTYVVTETIGTWSDPDKRGQLEFKVLYGNVPGSIFFYRNSGGTKIRIDFQRNGVNQVPFEFIVSEVQKTK